MDFPSIPNEFVEGAISFNSVDVELPELDQTSLSTWLSAVAKTYNTSIYQLSYVLCSDVYLHAMNVERLSHDTLTDIITFDLRDSESAPIEGECYISIDRVMENAASFGESTEVEFLRVVVHGLLHLCGLGDKTPEESERMRFAEDSALQLLVN